jgi:hypothetical protein
MQLTSIFMAIIFIAAIGLAVAAVKSIFGTSLFVASLVGVPLGYFVVMFLVWAFARKGHID